MGESKETVEKSGTMPQIRADLGREAARNRTRKKREGLEPIRNRCFSCFV